MDCALLGGSAHCKQPKNQTKYMKSHFFDVRSGSPWRRVMVDSTVALAFFLELFSKLWDPKVSSQKITALLWYKTVDFITTNAALLCVVARQKE